MALHLVVLPTTRVDFSVHENLLALPVLLAFDQVPFVNVALGVMKQVGFMVLG